MRTRHWRCTRLSALIAVLALLALPLGAVAAPQPGGPTRSTSERLAQKRYVAAGDRAYVFGAEDGSFPPMGWHIRGEMGGVWAHPIKLLDGYWFSVNGRWLPAATRFISGAGYVQMSFPAVNGVQVTRTEFAPDGSPVVLIGLTFRWVSGPPRAIRLTMDVRSELMGAYPWGWTTPSAKEANGKDAGGYDPRTGTLAFREPGKPWVALVRGATDDARRTTGRVGDEIWGPVPPDQRAGYLENGNGTGGELGWVIAPDRSGQTTFWIGVAGSNRSQAEAAQALQAGLTSPRRLLGDKVSGRLALLHQTRVTLPDAKLQAAFDWGKLNMADLRRTVHDAQIRFVDQGRQYPAPVATIPTLTGIGAGYPDYPWFFGTDGAYTAFPLVVSGQWDTAKNHLRSIRDVSIALNGTTGKVVHEVVTDGSVYFGANSDPGNTNETVEFASAVALVWQWTGDDAFRDEMYDFVNAGLHYVTSSLDKDGDGWPEGLGMVERSGMGSEKLDVTAYTWRALLALEQMARSKGDTATADWAAGKAAAMRSAFDAAWWMPAETLYADSLCNPGDEVPPDVAQQNGWVNVCTQAGQQLQQRHWINATPMEVGLAPTDHANAALDRLETPTFTGPSGLYHTGKGGGPDGKGELKSWTLPNSVMAVAEANYGRVGDDRALRYMRSIAADLDLEMPGALPEISPSPEYDPWVDFRERAMVMQAWSSYGIQWPVIHDFLGIAPDVPSGTLSVVPQVPTSWPRLAVDDLRVGDGTMRAAASHHGSEYTTTVCAPAGWSLTIGHTLPAGVTPSAVTLDGAAATYDVVATPRGNEVRVSTTTGPCHTLVVTAG